MNPIPWYLTILRLVVPISILRFPLVGMLASIYADIIDWNIIGVRSQEMDVLYQNWDKSLDAYTYLFIFWIVLHWKHSWAKITALSFFALRMVGQIIFFLTSWRPILFFFPNVFENFVILWLLLSWQRGVNKISLNTRQKYFMLGTLIIPKMIQEYFQHFLARQPWELFSLRNLLGFTGTNFTDLDSILWGVALYVIPMATFVIWLNKTKSSKQIIF